jgi:general secretion pathway protein I
VSESGRNRQTGFTLLEVLVAMAVVAVAMGALIKVSGGYAFNAGYLKQKNIAQWIARNKATEYRLRQEFPAPGRQQGTLEMARSRWQWEVRISNTVDRRIRRLDVAVTLADGDPDQPLVTLIAFTGQRL